MLFSLLYMVLRAVLRLAPAGDQATVVGEMPGVTRARTVLVPWKLKDVHQWNIPPSADEEGR